MSNRPWRGLLYEYSDFLPVTDGTLTGHGLKDPDIVFKVTGEPLKAKGAAEVAELIERTLALK